MIVRVIFKNCSSSFELTHNDDNDDDLKILKQQIEKQFNIKPYNQRLIFLGQEIKSPYFLKDNSAIYLVERLKLFQLYIKYFIISEDETKTLHTLLLNDNSFQDNILLLKIKIEEELPNDHKFHAKYQRLIYCGKYLDNSKTLADYKINTDDTIHLFSSCYANYYK